MKMECLVFCIDMGIPVGCTKRYGGLHTGYEEVPGHLLINGCAEDEYDQYEMVRQ
jgi:hypothetical protein